MSKTLFAFLVAASCSHSVNVSYSVNPGKFLCDMTTSIPGVLSLSTPWACPDTSQISAKAWCSDWTGLLCSGAPGNNIIQIDLNSLALSGSIPNSIGMVSTLKTLSLHTNNIFGTIPPTLGNLTLLESLHLERNSLEGTVPNSLTKLSQLKVLNVNYNYLTGTLPSGFTTETFNDDGGAKSSFDESTHIPSYSPTFNPSKVHAFL
jgi:Leucine-rich repeat (LRR) protein